MPAVIVDTGVWIAICDQRDRVENRATIEALALRMERLNVVVPWPTVYETLRTRFVRNVMALLRFERLMKRANVKFVDDEAYRQAALDLAFNSSLRRGRPLSMVDCLIRLVIEDVDFKIDYLATFNRGDFVDVCRRRHVEFLSG